MGFFAELGNKLDGFIWDVKKWFRVKHLTSFYYKWYLYYKLPEKENHPDYMKYLEHFNKMGQIYNWQYNSLKDKFINK